MKKRSVLIVGSGGREHALAWALNESPQADHIFVAPGNAGTAEVAVNVDIAAGSIDGLVSFALENEIGLTVVGPELPLAMGIVDAFSAAGLKVFGPSQAAAQLESSKAFAKAFMQDHGIPSAEYREFTEFEAARAYLEQRPGPIVVKASGLAAGKGVFVCDHSQEALDALVQIMVGRRFGQAGAKVILEERLSGPEVSLLAFTDGATVVPMLPARDHKRAFDGDQGPNTGGMGAYAPVPDVDAAVVDDIMERVMLPTVAGMAAKGTPYVGVLYAGLMLTVDGPKVLEFNCRFGDPETQVVLPMLKSDLVEVMLACVQRRLKEDMVQLRQGSCTTVVLAAPGYPDQYTKGIEIQGLEQAQGIDDALVFHAGTRRQGEQVVTSGGRVLAVSGFGNDLAGSSSVAYQAVDQVHFAGAQYRRDIGR